ncbi:MAG: hypothetical protein WAW96_21845 [Alphaproteobacteria bacterium]
MHFKAETLDGIAAGTITIAFRRWKRAFAKTGGRQRTRIGVLAIDDVSLVEAAAITPRDAKAAGYSDRAALIADLDQFGEGNVYRIKFHLAGEDPRKALREKSLGADEIDEIVARLARFDAASRSGPWTKSALKLIKKWPARRAPELAEMAGVETAPFKRNVRKLKELGLTESLEVGYRLSPRGRAVMKKLRI